MVSAKEEIVKAMEEIVSNLSPRNIMLQKIQMGRLFELYSDYHELIIMKAENEGNVNSVKVSDTLPSSSSIITKTSLDKKNKIIVGYLVRDLVGASVMVNNFKIRIREKLCRDLNLVHGDLLRVNYEDEQNLTIAKIEDSITAKHCKRGLVEFGIVSDDHEDDELVVSSYLKHGEVKKISTSDEENVIFRISDYEREKYKLQPGDIVDIAYHRAYPKTYKVVWKHLNSK